MPLRAAMGQGPAHRGSCDEVRPEWRRNSGGCAPFVWRLRCRSHGRDGGAMSAALALQSSWIALLQQVPDKHGGRAINRVHDGKSV
eukprot:scaffold1643_cov390-Prasinococcus_capsulatus_cf.AAC.4